MSDTPEGYGDSAWNESFFDANRNEEQMTEFGASNDDMMEFNSNTEGPGDGESRYFNCSMAELLEAVEKHKPIVEALEAEVKAQEAQLSEINKANKRLEEEIQIEKSEISQHNIELQKRQEAIDMLTARLSQVEPQLEEIVNGQAILAASAERNERIVTMAVAQQEKNIAIRKDLSETYRKAEDEFEAQKLVKTSEVEAEMKEVEGANAKLIRDILEAKSQTERLLAHAKDLQNDIAKCYETEQILEEEVRVYTSKADLAEECRKMSEASKSAAVTETSKLRDIFKEVELKMELKKRYNEKIATAAQQLREEEMQKEAVLAFKEKDKATKIYRLKNELLAATRQLTQLTLSNDSLISLIEEGRQNAARLDSEIDIENEKVEFSEAQLKQWQGKLDSLEQSLVELTDKNSIKKKELTDLNEKRRTAAKEKEEWELRVIESQKNLEGAEAKSRHMEAILTEKSVLLSEWEQRVDIETNNRMKLLEQKEEIEEKLNFCRATNQKLEEERVRSNAAFQSQISALKNMLKTLDDEEASLREALKNSQMTIHAADQKEKELKDKLKMHTKRQNELDCRYKEVLAAKEEREMQSVMLEEGKAEMENRVKSSQDEEEKLQVVVKTELNVEELEKEDAAMCEQIAKLDEEIMRQLEIQATLQAEIDAIQHQYRDQKLQMKALLADKDELNRGATQQLSQNSQSHSTMSRSDSDSSCSLDFSNVDLEMFAKKKVDRPESSLARAKRNLAETGLLKGGAAASQSTAKKQKSPKKRKMAEAEDVDILQMFD